MKRQKALVTPSVIKWAREKAFYSIDIAAKKIGVDANELKKWENGEKQPSLAKARKMSEVYRRPLASFYLSEPPQDFSLLKDFRTVAGKSPQYSTSLIFLMRQMQERQAWLSQYLKEQGYEQLSFIGSGSMQSSEQIMSKNIIKIIWDSTEQYSQVLLDTKNSESLLDKWILQCESKGIFISRTSNLNSHNIIPVEEARGFVISDKYAPFIFINSKDSKNAQLFTLLHELAHLWLGVSGIPDHFSNSYQAGRSNIEFFCNQTAAEILMPKEKINIFSKLKKSTQEELNKFIKENYGNFKVSRLAFLVRLKNFKMVSSKVFQSLWKEYIREHKEYEYKKQMKMKESTGGPSPNVLKIYANGESFTRIVFYSYKEGVLSGREASNLLDMKIDRMDKVMKIMETR